MQRTICTILGKTGSGKSTMIYQSIVPSLEAPVLILDTMGECRYGMHFERMRDLVDCLVYGIESRSGVYVLNATDDREAEIFFAVSYAMKAPHTIVVDEVDKYCSPRAIDPNLSDIIKYGRHYGISCVFAARRPSEVNPSIRSQSDLIVCFRQDEPIDIKAMKERGAEAERLPDLRLWKDTGKPSEYIVFGDYCNYYPYSDIL